jgi:methylase of polypeptide subunit release factors
MSSEYLQLRSVRETTRSRLAQLPENAFWSKGTEHELKIHRIHAYPAKFPAFITSKALAFAKSKGIKVKTVGDIFCGCGTVAFEARRNAIDFWGCDINPVATLIAAAKSNSYEKSKLNHYYHEIMIALRKASTVVELSNVAIERLDYWYPKEQFRNLAKLLNAIYGSVPSRSHYRQFFLCAFSNILKPTSRWLTKSIKPQLDPNKRPAEVRQAFTNQVRLMIEAWKQVESPTNNKIEIRTGNILDLTPPSKIDMIITSPPYVTSYEYADLHQLSSLWLGYASDYRELRKGSIGSAQHNLDFNREIKRLNTIGSRVVFSLFDRDKAIARSTAKYFLDMQLVANRCFRLLRRSGLALFVIGNTEYKGVRIDNATHLAESLLSTGFSRVRVAKRHMSGKILTPYRDSIGQFSGQSTGRHVYAEEFVLIANK